MPWKNSTPDGFIEIVVDPKFSGDLLAIATKRPVWIVESEFNRPNIDAAWLVGAERDLYSVNRCPLPDPEEREHDLFEILGVLDDHYGQYRGAIVHGLVPTDQLKARLEKEGFRVSENIGDGFICTMLPEVRGRLLWRPYTESDASDA